MIDYPSAPAQAVKPAEYQIGYGLDVTVKFQVNGIKPGGKDEGYYWVQYAGVVVTTIKDGNKQAPEDLGWRVDGPAKGSKTMPNMYMLQKLQGDHLLRDTPSDPLAISIVSVRPADDKKSVTLNLQESPAGKIPDYRKNVLGKLQLQIHNSHMFQTYLMKTGQKQPIGYISWGYMVDKSKDGIKVTPIDPTWHDGTDKKVWGK